MTTAMKWDSPGGVTYEYPAKLQDPTNCLNCCRVFIGHSTGRIPLHGISVDPSKDNDDSHDDWGDQIPHNLPVKCGNPAEFHLHLCNVAQELVHAIDIGHQDDLYQREEKK